MRKILAGAAAIASVIAVLAYGLAWPEATLLGPAVCRVTPHQGSAPEVSLTFDDGPSPFTPQILDILKANHIRATFFLCGKNAERYPELVRRIRDEGHEIGNHTYSHPYLYLMPEDRIASEIDRTQDILEKISGRRPTLFRPPYGVRWFTLWSLLKQRNLRMVMWTDRGYDGKLNADGITRVTLNGLSPGAIVLLHDGFETYPADRIDRSATVKALPGIIEGIRKSGYDVVPLQM